LYRAICALDSNLVLALLPILGQRLLAAIHCR
jgi:hypothetical protein